MKLPQLLRQAARYLVVGGGSTAVQLILVWALTPVWGGQRAFVFSWVISTALSTLGHRWFTFRRGAGAQFDQTVGYITSLVSLGANSVAMAALQPSSGVQGAAIVVVVNFLIGVGRFLLLRTWFLGRFRHERPPAEPDDRRSA